ncbi:hypothetical protein BACCIP111899_02052 [Bacillus rhizoplanae]|uniref:DUF2268 domain-containing protein n=1 Tax=Bacillus rhizoplanae TaxID=2880966 RepID=A0ABN7ZZU4_9BACI|nr:DUF2268 domain-containing protein [Bacillus rhizoplanae]CAG9612874.1 hypothetical protein BACCIP111899_02052 [Bacillus rhizoplanae]
MGVIKTAEWMREYYWQPAKICEKFTKYIPLQKESLYRFLVSKGMFRPVVDGEEEIDILQKERVWEQLAVEYKELQQWLKGPNIPVFILLSDPYNRTVQREYNGKAGLAMRNALFLFVSSQNSIAELKALLTHEYHHICRIHESKAIEEQYTILDTMVMEGLAEQAVYERHGDRYYAPWVSYYSKEEAIRFWNRFIQDKCDVKRGMREHDVLLHGWRLYPKMLGYAVGFHIVKDCVEHTKCNSNALLEMDAKTILKEAVSFES